MSPYTFSKRNTRGLVSRITRKYALSVSARGSASLPESPLTQYDDLENG